MLSSVSGSLENLEKGILCVQKCTSCRNSLNESFVFRGFSLFHVCVCGGGVRAYVRMCIRACTCACVCFQVCCLRVPNPLKYHVS